MEKDFNYYGYMPPFMDSNVDMNDIVMQYEQAFSYYRYLCMQMDYKIKCKEYEKLCASSNNEKRDRKLE